MAAACFAGEVALRRWARRRGMPFVPRKHWWAGWRKATYAAPVPFGLGRALLFGLTIAQLAQGRLFWTLGPEGWVAVAFGAFWMILIGLWNRGSAAAGAWGAADRGRAVE